MRDNRSSVELYALLEGVRGSPNVEDAVRSLHGHLCEALDYDALGLFAYAGGDGSAVFLEKAALTGRAIVTKRRELHPEPRARPGWGERFRSMMAAPLDDDGEIAGVLALYSERSGAFDPADLGVLLWIGPDLARAVRQALQRSPPLYGRAPRRSKPVQFDAPLARET